MDNKLTPNRNLLWESSRMILPEHKERILEHRQNLKRQNRPELDQQAVEEIERALQFSFHHGAEIGLTLYGEFENKIKRGVCPQY